VNASTIPEIKVDVLIIGTEAAGAKAAIEAHILGLNVLAVTKGAMGRSGATVMAGNGVQAPLGHMDPRDNADVYFADVLKGGAYLNNQKLVERLVNLANTEVPKMEQWGATFAKKKDGRFVQLQGPGSTYPRSLHAIGGGIQWRKAFRAEFMRQGMKPLEDFFVTKLLMFRGEVAGAMGVSLTDGQIVVLRGKVTILTTGGCGQLFLRTDMPSGATGDGMALAYDAGAELMDMEFHQFFPYNCYGPSGRDHYSVGSLRYNLHGKLYNSHGEDFLERYLPLSKGWGLRDPTSRAIYMENLAGRGSPSGGAYISVSHLPMNLIEENLKNLAPRLYLKVKKAGIDLTKEAFEVGPAVHYTCGGVRVNEECESSIPRLLIAGENAAGMDGAERIDAGPAICWCLTMGWITAQKAATAAKELDWLPVEADQVTWEQARLEGLMGKREGITGYEIKQKLKTIMWEKCGLIRNKSSLEETLKLVEVIKEVDLPRLSVPGASKCFNMGLVDALEVQNLISLAELTATSALMRQESRRAHYRTDFPSADNRNWVKNIIVRQEGGKMVLSTAVPNMHRMEAPKEAPVEENYG